MKELVETFAVLLQARWRQDGADDRGASAIEWAIMAITALLIAGLVAAAITAAVNTRVTQIA